MDITKTYNEFYYLSQLCETLEIKCYFLRTFPNDLIFGKREQNFERNTLGPCPHKIIAIYLYLEQEQEIVQL